MCYVCHNISLLNGYLHTIYLDGIMFETFPAVNQTALDYVFCILCATMFAPTLNRNTCACEHEVWLYYTCMPIGQLFTVIGFLSNIFSLRSH